MFRLFTLRLPPLKTDSFAAVHECPDCGLLCGMVAPRAGHNQCCPRCTKVLRRVNARSLDKATACYLAAAFFYILCVTTPMLYVILFGRTRESELYSGPVMLESQDLWQVATLVVLTTVLLPIIKVGGNLVVLIGLRLRRQPRWLPSLFSWLKHIHSWTMVEVYLLGFIVAYTRLQAMTQVLLGPAVYGLIGLMLCLTTADTVLDPQAVWERLRRPRRRTPGEGPHVLLLGCDTCYQVSKGRPGDHCPRCGEILHKRKANSVVRSSALTIAALILYVPSNIFPIMTITKLGRSQSYTITGGMLELAHAGLMPLAILVFVASIVIPIFKLLSLGLLLILTHQRSRWELPLRTRLFRLIDFIGRWSMVDVFMVSILVALVHFGQFADIVAETGALYFASVVILTIAAVECFDPRLMWDAVGETAPGELTPSEHSTTPRNGVAPQPLGQGY